MSKAIVVLNEMPESCADCCLWWHWGNSCRGNKQPIIDGSKKLKDCPLKPLPKIKEIEWSDSFGKHNYKKGYNDCIKDILGEEIGDNI